jgi:hypothetical protein
MVLRTLFSCSSLNFFSSLSSGMNAFFTKYPCLPSIIFISFNLNLNINNFPYNSCMTFGTSSTFPCSDSSKFDTDVFMSFLDSSSNGARSACGVIAYLTMQPISTKAKAKTKQKLCITYISIYIIDNDLYDYWLGVVLLGKHEQLPQ